MCKLSSSKYYWCYCSGQPRSESTVPGMVHACRRQPLPRRAPGLKKQMERNEAFLSLFYRGGIKCSRSHGGSVASLQQHQEECYTFGFELQTGGLHTSPSCCSPTDREVLVFEQAFSRQGVPAPCPSWTARAAQREKAAIPQTSSRRCSYIFPMQRVNVILSSTGSASALSFFPVILI